jgi:hypothetical protein
MHDDYLACWIHPTDKTMQGYVYRHVAIKIWGQIMNASCQTAAGVVEARNKERKRERERERERK